MVNLAVTETAHPSDVNTDVTITISIITAHRNQNQGRQHVHAIANQEGFPRNIPSLTSFTRLATLRRDIMTPLHEIIQQRKLTALFQPILNLKTGEFYGYEGLIRGPSDSTLHSPINLFGAAAKQNLIT